MTAGLRLGSLFSGCGGLDLGVNAVLGRHAPDPVVRRARNPELWSWLMGLPAGWLTPAGTLEEQLRVAGNAVVPQQVAAALPTLLARLTETATEAAA